jgi:hypothetical protein
MLTKFNWSIFLSNHKVQFWISVIRQVFSFGSPYCGMKKVSADFSVKSSWEVHWIIMFQEDAVRISWLAAAWPIKISNSHNTMTFWLVNRRLLNQSKSQVAMLPRYHARDVTRCIRL